MNRIISKVENNKLIPVELTSNEPKKALVNFISNKYSLSKSNVKNKIQKENNRYSIEVNGEIFNIIR